jgi:hypothetical protein
MIKWPDEDGMMRQKHDDNFTRQDSVHGLNGTILRTHFLDVSIIILFSFSDERRPSILTLALIP